MGLFGFGTSKTKSYYANKIAEEERNLAEMKKSLIAVKSYGKYGNVGPYKMRIEQQKGYIASLKAEMKAAPKD